MLSQKISKEALLVIHHSGSSESGKADMEDTIELFEVMHSALRYGNEEMNLDAMTEPVAIEQWDVINEDWESFKISVVNVLDGDYSDYCCEQIGRQNLQLLGELDHLVSIFESRASGKIEFSLKINIITGIIAIIALILVLFYIERHIVRPLVYLTKRSKLIAQGDFSNTERICVSQTNEIGTLESQFLLMQKQLDDMVQSLKGSIISGISIGLMAVDRNNKIEIVNPRFETITSFNEENILGRNCYEIFGDSLLLPEHDQMKKAIESKSITSMIDIEYENKDGRFFNLRAVGAPIFGAEEKIMGGMITYMDMTADTKRRKEISQLLVQAKKSAAKEKELLREVNHRVKNNLAAIIGLFYAEQKYMSDDTKKIWEPIRIDLTKRIQAIAAVHSMLTTSKWSPILISDLTRNIIIDSFNILPKHKKLKLDISGDPFYLEPEIAHSIGMLINELVANSIKHVVPVRDVIEITFDVDVDEELMRVTLSFRDNGPGFSEGQLDLSNHNLGYSIIKNIVNGLRHGSIILSNDNGAVITISFEQQ